MKTYKKTPLLLLGCVLAALLAAEALILSTAFFAAPLPGDAIVVLGTRVYGTEPGPMLRLRLEKALALYRQGYAPRLLVSGGRGGDEEISEAQAMKNYLVAAGVAPEAVLLENESTSTYENLRNSATILQQQGWTRIVVVTNRSHLYRSLKLARLQGLTASGAAAPMGERPAATAYQYLREAAAVLSLMRY